MILNKILSVLLVEVLQEVRAVIQPILCLSFGQVFWRLAVQTGLASAAHSVSSLDADWGGSGVTPGDVLLSITTMPFCKNALPRCDVCPRTPAALHVARCGLRIRPMLWQISGALMAAAPATRPMVHHYAPHGTPLRAPHQEAHCTRCPALCHREKWPVYPCLCLCAVPHRALFHPPDPGHRCQVHRPRQQRWQWSRQVARSCGAPRWIYPLCSQRHWHLWRWQKRWHCHAKDLHSEQTKEHKHWYAKDLHPKARG